MVISSVYIWCSNNTRQLNFNLYSLMNRFCRVYRRKLVKTILRQFRYVFLQIYRKINPVSTLHVILSKFDELRNEYHTYSIYTKKLPKSYTNLILSKSALQEYELSKKNNSFYQILSQMTFILIKLRPSGHTAHLRRSLEWF